MERWGCVIKFLCFNEGWQGVMSEIKIIKIGELDIKIDTITDYVCISDFIQEERSSKTIINNWMRNKNTIEFLGLWERFNNINFKGIEFDTFRAEAGSNRFILSPAKWIQKTNAIGIKSKAGRYNSGTYAHEDIALEFASWLSPEFKIYFINEFKRLKKEEATRKNDFEDWNVFREFAKMGYKIHTDAVQQNVIPVLNIAKNKEYIIYSSEADLFNIAVFGMKASDFAKQNPNLIKKGKNIRDYASKKALNIIDHLQSANAKMIRDGFIDQEKRFEQLVIQAFDEKNSLGLNNETDLFQNDLFIQNPYLKNNNKAGVFIQNNQVANVKENEGEIKKTISSKNKED